MRFRTSAMAAALLSTFAWPTLAFANELTANAGPDRLYQSALLPFILQGGGGGPDGAVLSAAWILRSSPEGSDPQLTQTPEINPGSALLVLDQVGAYELRFAVSDGTHFAVDDMWFYINTPPEALVTGPQTVDVGETAQYDADLSFDLDSSPDPLSYSWRIAEAPLGSVAPLSAISGPQTSISPDLPGEYRIEVTVSDGVQSDTAGRKLKVKPEDGVPVAVAPDPMVVDVGALLVLDGSASHDPSLNPIQYQWQFHTRPAGSVAFLDEPYNVNPITFVDQVGLYRIELRVSNDSFTSAASHTVICAYDGKRPFASAGLDSNPGLGETFTLRGEGRSFLEEFDLNYTWTLISHPEAYTEIGQLGLEGADPVPTEAVFAERDVSMSPSVAGTYEFELRVSDGVCTTAIDIVEVEVGPHTYSPPPSDNNTLDVGRFNEEFDFERYAESEDALSPSSRPEEGCSNQRRPSVWMAALLCWALMRRRKSEEEVA